MKNPWKITITISTCIIVFLLLFMLFLPSVFSNFGGKRLMEKYLSQRFHSHVTINQLHLSWFGPQVADNITITTSEYTLQTQTFQIHSPLWSFLSAKKLTKKALLSLNTIFFVDGLTMNFPHKKITLEETTAKVFLQNQTANFYAVGKTQDLQKKGEFHFSGEKNEGRNYQLKGTCHNFPLAILDSLTTMLYPSYKNFFSKILGPHLSITTNLHLTDNKGPINLDLASTYCHTLIEMQRNQNQILLKSPVTATLHISPDLSKLVLKNISPIYVSGFSSSEPFIIRVSDDAFSWPIPFKKRDLHVHTAMLDMGKIQAKIGDSLASLLAILKFSSLRIGDTTSLWFTPVNFQIKEGILYTDRLDFLIDDTIHLCTWGKINLLNNKIDMILGITADALKEAFGIKGIPEDFVLQLPMKGTTNKIHIDKAKAATKIALLMTTSQGKGILNNVLSTLGIISEKDAPPPKKPFPWEGVKKSRKKSKNPLDIIPFFSSTKGKKHFSLEKKFH